MPRAMRSGGRLKQVDAIVHADKRANLPTADACEFVSPEVEAPIRLLYPRDPSLDPQLVWKGKDENDASDLVVDAPPVYIQEKIDPRALIADLRQAQHQQAEAPQPSLFETFDGLGPLDLVEFYRHDANWSNRMVLGDSLHVMASLAGREALRGKVQMVYIDPPYGIKFGSNWQASARNRDVKDGKVEDASREAEQIKAFRDTWELGIHSYLTYLRDRFQVARELLTESGSVFVQIGDENVHLTRCLLDEVFGSSNFVSMISYATTGGFESSTLSRLGDHILWYSKNRGAVKYRQLYQGKTAAVLKSPDYRYVELAGGIRRLMTRGERDGSEMLPSDARVFRLDNITSQGGASGDQPIALAGRTFRPGRDSHWKATWPTGMNRLLLADRVLAREHSLAYLRYLGDFPYVELANLWTDTSVAGAREGKWFVVQTNPLVIERCILMSTDPGDLVLA